MERAKLATYHLTTWQGCDPVASLALAPDCVICVYMGVARNLLYVRKHTTALNRKYASTEQEACLTF